MEQMQYNLLFRWFVGLEIDDPVWVPTVFSKNRDRLLTTDIAQKFLAAILAHREIAPLLSNEHFSVDGTLIKAWASVKSFQPKPEQEAAEPGGGSDDPPAPPPAAEAEPTETKPERAWPGWRVVWPSMAECRAFDPTGAADPAEPAADPVLGPLRAAADGADGLQPDVPLVFRTGHRRSGAG